jgi:NADP-dependent 3-hydroxy acid dehydrogenase YdfG
VIRKKWKQVKELNILGALRLIRAFVPPMLEKAFGEVVFISSVAAGKASPYGAIYAATKAALETIAENLRLEVLPKIRVFTIGPGVTDTNFFSNTISGSQSAEDIGFGALPPSEIAQAAMYALTRPREIAFNHLILRPSMQPF